MNLFLVCGIFFLDLSPRQSAFSAANTSSLGTDPQSLCFTALDQGSPTKKAFY